VNRIPAQGAVCGCSSAMQYAVITDPKKIPAALKKNLKPLIGKYLP